MVVSEDVKNRIKDLYYNTNLRISRIYKIIFPRKECTYEEFYEILDETVEVNKRNADRKKCIELIPEEELFELRYYKKMTYKEISNYYEKEKNIHIEPKDISLLCEKIYSKKGLENVKYTGALIKNIEDLHEDMFNLRENGYSLYEIQDYCVSKGKNVSVQLVKKRLDKMYESKGIEQPKKRVQDIKIKISLLEMYKLRIDEKFSYGILEKYYKERGIKVSRYTIKNRDLIIKGLIEKYQIHDIKDFYKCLNKENLLIDENDNLENLENIINSVGLEKFRIVQIVNDLKRNSKNKELQGNNENSEIMEQKKAETSKKREYIKWHDCNEYLNKEEVNNDINYNNEEVSLKKPSYIDLFKLKGQGLTCKQIAQKFIEQQKPISYQTINELCNEVNKSVVISRNIKSKISKNDIYKKIIRLKAQGKSYRAIQKYLKEKHNIEMTYETVRKRAGKIIKESNQLIEALDEETVKKALLRLKYTKNANYAQLNKLAKYYGFDIDFSKNYKYNEKDEDLEK